MYRQNVYTRINFERPNQIDFFFFRLSRKKYNNLFSYQSKDELNKYTVQDSPRVIFFNYSQLLCMLYYKSIKINIIMN